MATFAGIREARSPFMSGVGPRLRKRVVVIPHVYESAETST